MATYFRPVLSLTSRTYDELFDLAESVRKKMDGNLLFPSPPVSISDQQLANNKFFKLIEQWGPVRSGGSHETLVKLRAARNDVRRNLRALANYVDSIAHGDPAVVAASGFPSNSERNPLATMPAPQGLKSPY